MKDKIVFFGTADFSADSLHALIEAGFNVAAVVTKPDQPAGRGQKIQHSAVKQLATEAGIKLFQPVKLGEIVGDLQVLKADIGVVVAYGKMIPLEALEAFRLGIVNIHGSLLPKYRGASPIEAAILNGDDEAGVTLMQIGLEMDSGPVFAEAKIKLKGSETRPELYEKLSKLGAKLIVDKLPDILARKLKAKPQDDSQATYVKLIQKSNGEIDWNKPAKQIERQIRAYLGWPGSRTKINDREIIITQAHVIPSAVEESFDRSLRIGRDDNGNLFAICGDGQKLAIDKLKPIGKTEMTGAQFLAGHQI